MSPPETSTGTTYLLDGNAAAREVFNQRTVEQDAPLAVPYLRPGMRLVDFGCGAGSLACGLARLVAPGDVLGVDSSADAIDRARTLAAQSGLTNVHFSVANVTAMELPPQSFDVAHFSRVLMHLNDPEVALRLAFHSLKSGGMIAACEAYGAGDWATGPSAEAISLLGNVLCEEHRAIGVGTDKLIGGRLPPLLRQAGFERVVTRPCYSAVLSSPKAVGAIVRSGWGTNFLPVLMRHGFTEERCEQLFNEIAIWSESEDSISAYAECAVIAWKP